MHRNKTYGLLSVVVFLFLFIVLITSRVFGVQEIYIADDPLFFKRIETMKGLGWSCEQIREYLFQKNYLRILTTEEAERKFGFTWVFGRRERSQENLPRLILVNMGETGYGVAAMDDIPQGTLVVETTGEVRLSRPDDESNGYAIYTNETTRSEEPYTIDERERGNAGRFIQHLPSEMTLWKEVIFLNPEKHPLLIFQIATENLERMFELGQNLPAYSYLKSKRKIDAFEHLGYNYYRTTRFRPTTTIRLFYRSGIPVPTNEALLGGRIIVTEFPLPLGPTPRSNNFLPFNFGQLLQQIPDNPGYFVPVQTEARTREGFIIDRHQAERALQYMQSWNPFIWAPLVLDGTWHSM